MSSYTNYLLIIYSSKALSKLYTEIDKLIIVIIIIIRIEIIIIIIIITIGLIG